MNEEEQQALLKMRPFLATLYLLATLCAAILLYSSIGSHMDPSALDAPTDKAAEGIASLSIEEYAAKGPGCGETQEIHQRLQVSRAREILREITPQVQSSSIPLDEAIRLYDAGTLKDSKAKYVHVPAVNKYILRTKFGKLESWHRRHDDSLSNLQGFETWSCKGKTATDCYGRPIRFIPLFAKLYREAAEETGVCPDFKWGERDAKLQAVMFARTEAVCVANPWTYLLGKSKKKLLGFSLPGKEAGLAADLLKCGIDQRCIRDICDKAVGDVVGTPYGSTHELGAAGDDDRWKRLDSALQKRGIACGTLKRDMHHCDPTMMHKKK